MKPACTTRVRYVVKIAISTCKNGSLGLNVFFVACVVALMPCESAQSIPSTWGQSGTTGSQGNSFFRPQDDIFQGAINRPEIAPPPGNFGEVPPAGNIIPAGVAGNAGAAIRNVQSGNPMGAFRSVGGAGQQGASVIPAVGQIAGAVGAGRTGLPSGMGNIAQTVQAGAQIVGAVGQIQGTLGRFQQGGSGIQNVAGMVGGVAGINQGMGGLLNQGMGGFNQGMGGFGNQVMGSFGQGRTPSLGGILQGLRGQTGNGMFGNGMGAGPFGQFLGQNNQIMLGMRFLALLQQIFGMFFPVNSAMQFNNANTGQSARTAFVNLMGANAGSANGFPSSMPTGACDNSAAYQEQYQRVHDALEGSSFIGTVPEDGAQYGITTGSREEWANFFTRLARVESGFNPNTAADINGTREGVLTSFGVYQMGQSQFNTFGGGNIYNATDNTNAFVRYAESMYFGTGSYGAGGGQNRLAGRSGNQWLGLSAGYGPLRRTLTGSQNSNESFLLASNAC